MLTTSDVSSNFPDSAPPEISPVRFIRLTPACAIIFIPKAVAKITHLPADRTEPDNFHSLPRQFHQKENPRNKKSTDLVHLPSITRIAMPLHMMTKFQ